MKPDIQKLSSELAEAVVALEFNPTAAIEAAKGDTAPDGIMRMEVPFYIGNSVAQPSNWDQPLFFSAEALPGIIEAAESQISEGKLPLTIYARHQHSRTADHLPIGRVAGVRREGNTGYALLEVLDDGHFGTQTQKLVRAGMLNSVSLRSKPGLNLEERKVNGEEMLAAVGMEIAGIDFAPEGPAMPTYGVRVLAEANVEPVTPSSQDDDNTPEEESPDMEITLEAVRARADIVSEIQKPVLAERDTVSKERDNLKAERDAAVARAEKAEGRVVELEAAEVKRGVDEVVAKALARCPEKGREAAKTVFAEAVKDVKTIAEAKAAVFDLMLEAGIDPKAPDSKDDSAAKTPAQILAESFGKPVGKTDAGGETPDEVDAEEGEVAEMAGAMPVPTW